MTDLMDRRLTEAGRRWRDEQPPPPAVPLELLETAGPARGLRRSAVVAAAAAIVVGAGALAMLHPVGGTRTTAPPSAPRTDYVLPMPRHAVAWADLSADHPHYPHVRGKPITPYDAVFASGRIAGTARPDDTLVFTASLESPTDLPLVPCPDFSIAFGSGHGYTGQLNCAQVTHTDRRGRPYLPAHTKVAFEMQVRVPDEPGRQKVLWTLDGPSATPGFYGIVRVVRSGS